MADKEDMDSEGVLFREVRMRLEQADGVWRRREVGRLAEALSGCDGVLVALGEAGEAGAASERSEAAAGAAEGGAAKAAERVRFAAALWVKRGHLLELRAAAEGRADAMVEALRGYERAIDLLTAAEGNEAGSFALSGAWLNRGNALQALGTRASRTEAVRSYDRAIVLLAARAERGAVPGAADAETAGASAWRTPLGAAWLNRGVALRTLAEEEEGESGAGDAARAGAAESFERAIAALAPRAPEDAAARRSLAAAWTNLGLVRLGKDPRGAVEAHARALAAAGETAAGNDRAALWLNLGQARREAGEIDGALEAAREAVAAVAGREAGDPAAAEIGLLARHAACLALGDQLVAEGEAITARTSGRLAEAAALVEDGLGLLRTHGEGRTARVSEAGARLFEFGAWLYRTYGEERLAQFLSAHLEPADARKIEIAGEALALARQQIMRRGFEELIGDAAGRIAEQLAGLRELEARLRELAAEISAGVKS